MFCASLPGLRNFTTVATSYMSKSVMSKELHKLSLSLLSSSSQSSNKLHVNQLIFRRFKSRMECIFKAKGEIPNWEVHNVLKVACGMSVKSVSTSNEFKDRNFFENVSKVVQVYFLSKASVLSQIYLENWKCHKICFCNLLIRTNFRLKSFYFDCILIQSRSNWTFVRGT